MENFYQLCLLLLFELLMLIGLFQHHISTAEQSVGENGALYAKWLSFGIPVLMLGQISSLTMSLYGEHVVFHLMASAARFGLFCFVFWK